MRAAPLLLLALVLPACGPSESGNGDDGGDDDDDSSGAPDARPVPPPTGDCKTLTATIRDFKIEHPDFEEPDGDSDYSYPGLVKPDLGADGTPVYAPAGPVEPHTDGPDAFAQWYHDVDGVNMHLSTTIPLTESGGVWSYTSSAFFPIDGQGWGDEGLAHNFHFTTEIHTAFKYDGGETFHFSGDDDLWIFVNGKLALDLGGLHPELQGTIDFDAQASALGITVGNNYAMDIFHAERHTEDSNFKVETTINCFVIP